MPSNRIFAPRIVRSLEALNFSYYKKDCPKKDACKMKTNKTVKRGDRILSEKPFVYALRSQYRKERCDNCLTSTKVMKCSNCNYVYYCNRACQMEAWPLHKFECTFLKRIFPKTVPDAARMLCRIIIKLNNGGDMEKGYYTSTCFRKFRDLMSHYQEIKHDSRRLEHLESLHGVLCEMMQDSAIVPNQSELLTIYGRLITNGFNILDAEMNSIATAIFLGVSITDHSCKPNAVATFEGTTLHVQATEDIDIDRDCLDWSKIFISYIELLNTPAIRRRQLKDNYYFLCTCSKCIDPQETLEMEAACCPNRKCKAYVDISLNNCPSCDAGINPRYRKGFLEAMELSKHQLNNMKDIAYLDVCKFLLNKQEELFHPLNCWYVKTLDAAFEAAIDVGKWKEALEYGKKLLPGFRKYYGDWNPLLGLLYLKLAKIQHHESHLKECIENFQEARKILEITHGKEHSLIQCQLKPLLVQALAEATD
ncbi:SET and MYND domain containing, class 3 isoform X1 [Haematobia irritans]|uniref:SET and MYND domain containing, class 3 isoform X1 n=2 Tax=Haematobia irritans TaxID=7368 RepID=UPI003F501C0B